MRIIRISLLILFISCNVNADTVKTYVKDGMTYFIQIYDDPIDYEIAEERQRQRLAKLDEYNEKQLARKKERWLLESKQAHEIELARIKERTALANLEAWRIESRLDRASSGTRININTQQEN